VTDATPAAKSVRPLRALLPFLLRYRRQIVLATLFLLGAAVSTLATPFAVKVLVDGGLAAPANLATVERLTMVREYFALLFLVAVSLGVFTAARFYMVSWIGERVTADLRRAVYAHVLNQSPQFFETLKTGEVLSRLTTDTTVIQNVVGSSISMGLRNTVIGIGAIGMLIATNPVIMITVLFIIALVVIPAMLIGRRVRRLSRASQDRIADTSGIAAEVLNAIPVVQSFTQEDAEAGRFSSANESAFTTSIRRTRTRAALTAFVIIGVFGSLLYGLYGGVQAVFAGRLSPGDLSQTALYIALLAGSVAVLAEVWGDLLRAAGATERLMELLATRSHISDPAHPRALPAVHGGVRVELFQVRFAYPSRTNHPVLHDLSLEIEPGQTVALVGPSGAGKTTLINLVARFIEPTSGAIELDGVPIRELTRASLRRQIALVSQDVVLFDDTIAANIAYGETRGASTEAIRAAAEAAYLLPFIESLPQGFRTQIGENAVKLSGGQRQRLSIARALLKDAPVLLLDEATSALDSESERFIQQSLDRLMRDRTTFVVAHRLSTIERADRIVVLEAGKVVEVGPHRDLLARGGLYAHLHSIQYARKEEVVS